MKIPSHQGNRNKETELKQEVFMKKKLTILSLLFLTVCFCACGSEEVISSETGGGEIIFSETGDGVLTSFSATDIDNNIVDQTIFSDSKLTMVNIWGTFCSPCVEEMPILAEFDQEYADQGFQVVGIIIDAADKNLVIKQNKLDSAKEITAATNANYIHLLPSKSLNDALLADIQSVPYTIFVNSEGYQVGENYPGSKTKQEWQKIITALLEVQD